MFIDTQLSQISLNVYKYFSHKITDISKFNPNNIFFTEDLNKDTLIFGDTEHDYSNASGITIHPNETVKDITIFICIPQNEFNLFEFVKTLMHEFIHVADYLKLSEMYFNGECKNLEEYEYFQILKEYSDFCAYSKADIYTAQYFDFVSSSEQIIIWKEQFKNLFDDYFNQFAEQTLQTGILADLWQLLGNLHILDYCNNIENLNDSCIYTYLPKLIRSKRQQEIIYQIYTLCIQIENHRDFSLLGQLSQYYEDINL